MQKCFPVFMVLILSTIVLAACGTTVAPTKKVALGQGQELTFRSIGSQSIASQVKVVFTTTIPGLPGQNAVLYGQVFIDDQLMDGMTSVPEGDFSILPGLTIFANGFTQQLVTEYDPELWEVMP